MIIKVNDKTNERVTENLNFHPMFLLRCKLGEILKERGLSFQELSDLTGLRVATISEIVNMKRTTLNVPHLLVIAKTLRITDVANLFEFIMPKDTRTEFENDQALIELNGSVLPEQEEYLYWLRRENKLIKDFQSLIKKKPTSN